MMVRPSFIKCVRFTTVFFSYNLLISLYEYKRSPFHLKQNTFGTYADI